ncbi:MAG: HAD family hydrolase [Abditibacteriales bacterium]|nr:HAD family hydrolase [Abditibacteriales bacterium]MDW8366182.1 HAD family hydrolase [Abditibacteriales bacterium]
MNSQPVRGVLFDFDGTLAHLNIDFSLMRARALHLAQQFEGFEAAWASLDTLEMIEAVGAAWSASDPSRARQFREQSLAAVQEIEMEAARASYLFPETEPLLRWLQEQHLKVGIVTRNCEAALLSLLGGARQWCDALLPREKVKYVKPHPEHLTKAMQALQLSAANVIVVGDGAMDMLAAKRLHLRAVGVTSGRTDAEKLQDAGADWIIPRVGELPRLMREQGWV